MEGGTDVFSVKKARLTVFEAAINEDHEYKASSAGVVCCFAVRCADTEDGLVITIDDDNTRAGHINTRVESLQNQSSSSGPEFTLYAQSDHWRQFFSAIPKRPFQSYWGMLRLLGTEADVKVEGDLAAFTTHAHLWRLILDKVRNGMHPPWRDGTEEGDYTPDDERDDDSIIGHYTWLKLSSSIPLGKCKIFYEVSGQGEQQLLFLHTAGADSRQFHSMMMSKDLQQQCTMYAFDLPGHGRSFPGSEQYPLSYANSEEFYIAVIGQFIAKLGLRDVVVSGASMGGQVCLAVALRAQELNVRGVIPCEACDYLPKQQAQSIYGLAGDESVLNPERVCGMISPTSPEVYKRLNWWIYSSQAARIFPGDLKFYFEGWDGRDRMRKIDTRVCPVYMLTGEYDYSCSVDASRATAEKIKGAVFEEMNGLGHFPFSEDPEKFLPYFKRALEHIRSVRSEQDGDEAHSSAKRKRT
ncbi:hypothetical protein LTR99_005417 [Exophiala xenobiotica]|uniref:AB hydrolase-1 domain-containing protein n=1 Tax=Vermiconidia calcicola TaxID=1690605 RepID=A0AAV9Q5S4_9PEZI|nr:hypothetical protein LTR99_005417 [Exophiala xenobiotica]KAK5535822.1 hypothetical protein LTR25_005724 [Vermiconidia calcicola]KAK5548762.1 hypothetical protein LTR23_001251 [Chaetothyriales sp. CCFEE 6169]KAK5364304.1 hypothetical protein LTS13_008918 [Exophiala xenobiotica]KAK5399015.1 hypothetical protein LTR79_004013 [Exophiala xenobiotica]